MKEQTLTGFLKCITGAKKRRGLPWLLGIILSIGAGLWAPVTQGGTLPAGYALYLWGYNDSGVPTILLDVYGIKPNMMVEDLRNGGTFSYTSSSINGNTTRMVIAKNGTSRYFPDDALTMDLTFTSATSGLLRNNYSIEYENGIIVDTAGIRDGIFRLVAIPPGTPVASQPSGASDKSPYFSWWVAQGATWYQVWVERNGQRYAEKWTQSTYWSPGDWLSGNYTWWVRAYNGVYGDWSSGKTFTIASYAPNRSPAIFAPRGSQSIGTSRPRFSWQAVGDASWYRVWISRDGQGFYAEKWVQAPTTSWMPAADFPGGDYKWWIAGWSVDGYGPWSDGVSFSIPTMRPDAIELVSPTDSLMLASDRVTYQWNADERATWYQFWVGRDGSEFHNQWYSSDDIVYAGKATATVSLHKWGRYKWYVRGWGPDGYGRWSTAGEFVLGQPTVLFGDADALTWDELSSAAEWYQVSINDVSSGGRVQERTWWFSIGDTTIVPEGRSVAVTPALTTGDYEWTIRPWSSTWGLGPWSDVQTLSVP